MKVVGRGALASFVRAHPDARAAVASWLAEAEAGTWQTPTDIKRRYPSASILGDSQVIFNIKGNHHRLLVRVAFATQVVVVSKIGTHAEYDKWKV